MKRKFAYFHFLGNRTNSNLQKCTSLNGVKLNAGPTGNHHQATSQNPTQEYYRGETTAF